MHEHRREGAELLFLPPGEDVPNNPRLPVVLHRGAVLAQDPAAAEALFRAHGWRPAWRDGIFDWPHYHAHAHEALAVVAGSVRLRVGGERGVEVALAAGDVVVLPAGTGHMRLAATEDLLVVGAYPVGSAPPDMRRAAPEEVAMAARAVAATEDPATDPVTGAAYPRA
jgi:uncharacterized protein YjlB